jgi:hypothetical protein
MGSEDVPRLNVLVGVAMIARLEWLLVCTGQSSLLGSVDFIHII